MGGLFPPPPPTPGCYQQTATTDLLSLTVTSSDREKDVFNLLHPIMRKYFSRVDFLFFPVERVMKSWSPSHNAQQNIAMKKYWSSAAIIMHTTCNDTTEDWIRHILVTLCNTFEWYKMDKYKFTVVYCESVNLIGYIIVCYLLIVNSYASVHIAHQVWTWFNIVKQFFLRITWHFFFFLCNETTVNLY